MNYLKSDVENEERIVTAIQGFSLGSNFKFQNQKSSTSCRKKRVVPVTAGVVNFITSKTA